MPATEFPLHIRAAGRADAPTLAAMIRSLARYEGKANVEHITPDAVCDWAFGPEPAFHALLAEDSPAAPAPAPLGYLAWYPVFSPFKGGRVMLVENLWVEEAARGRGVGKALLRALAREAGRRGLARMELNVRRDNEATRRFYASLGFTLPGEEVCRIEDDALARLAQG
ncbi:GNAT family N-acetyltransferase [Aquibaculum sediminis]|uniref:GNAT family N-acetyltransferase n=1 Tax=Aquibaculum sediminis TaxID=3231907 RepID=UPI003454334F